MTSGHSGCSSYPVQQRTLCPALVRAMIMSRRVLVLPTPRGPCTTAISFCMVDGAIKTASWLSLLSHFSFISRRIDWYFALLSFERACAGLSVRSTTSAGAWLDSDQKARRIGSSSSGKYFSLQNVRKAFASRFAGRRLTFTEILAAANSWSGLSMEVFLSGNL